MRGGKIDKMEEETGERERINDERKRKWVQKQMDEKVDGSKSGSKKVLLE